MATLGTLPRGGGKCVKCSACLHGHASGLNGPCTGIGQFFSKTINEEQYTGTGRNCEQAIDGRQEKLNAWLIVTDGLAIFFNGNFWKLTAGTSPSSSHWAIDINQLRN